MSFLRQENRINTINIKSWFIQTANCFQDNIKFHRKCINTHGVFSLTPADNRPVRYFLKSVQNLVNKKHYCLQNECISWSRRGMPRTSSIKSMKFIPQVKWTSFALGYNSHKSPPEIESAVKPALPSHQTCFLVAWYRILHRILQLAGLLSHIVQCIVVHICNDLHYSGNTYYQLSSQIWK